MTPIQLKTQNAYPTYAKFLEYFSPAQLIVQYDDVNTIAKSVTVINKRITLEDINIIYSDAKTDAGVDFVRKWLDFLNKFSNLNKQLTETKAVAYMIYKDYKYFYLTDLKIVFEKIMRCEYGIFYGSVDAPRILGAFINYSQERSATEKSIQGYVQKEMKAYMDPLHANELKLIEKELDGKYTDENLLRDERRKRYAEVWPKLQKLYDEMLIDVYKKIE